MAQNVDVAGALRFCCALNMWEDEKVAKKPKIRSATWPTPVRWLHSTFYATVRQHIQLFCIRSSNQKR